MLTSSREKLAHLKSKPYTYVCITVYILVFFPYCLLVHCVQIYSKFNRPHMKLFAKSFSADVPILSWGYQVIYIYI